jgi:hypothetical protein
MKRFGIIIVSLVLALGVLGVGYAAWFDTLTITGTVETGIVCLDWYDPFNFDECVDPPATNEDFNLDLVRYPNWTSGPPPWIQVDKDVACTEWEIIDEGKTLLVTIHNGYPLYYADLELHAHNCGTLPLKLGDPVIEPLNFTLASEPWTPNNGGEIYVDLAWAEGQAIQLEPCDDTSVSLIIIIQQIAEQNRNGEHQDGPYQFTLTWHGIQWNEFGDFVVPVPAE